MIPNRNARTRTSVLALLASVTFGCSDRVRLEAPDLPALSYDCRVITPRDLTHDELATLRDYTARLANRIVEHQPDTLLLQGLASAYGKEDWHAVQSIVVAQACEHGTLDYRPPRFPQPGSRAPEVAFRDLFSDAEVELGMLRGRLTIVNFWATWCKPCIEKYPELVALSDAYADQLVVVNVLYEDNAGRARSWLQNQPTNGHVMQLTDASKAAGRVFGVLGIPATFILSSDHTVLPACSDCRYRHFTVADFADQLAAGEWLGNRR